MLKEKILLIGGGGHCKSVIDVIEQQNRFEIAGIVDKKELIGESVLGYEVIACDTQLKELREEYKYAVITVGQVKDVSIRKKLYENLKDIGFELPVIISPRAYVSKHAIIAEGAVIMHDVLINASTVIMENCIINSKALIEHDAIIEKHCHISTGAIINGGVEVGEDSFIGSNVVTKQYIKIKKNSFVKAGSLQV